MRDPHNARARSATSADTSHELSSVAPQGQGLEDRISQSLLEAEFSFQRDVAVRNLVVDFLVRHERAKVVLEARVWEPSPQNLERAHNQALQIREITQVDRVLVVVEGLTRPNLALDVVPEEGVVSVLRDVAAEIALGREARGSEQLPNDAIVYEEIAPRESAARPSQPKRTRGPIGPRKRIFAAMPFDPSNDDVFYVAIVGAAKSIRADAERIDQNHFTGDIVQKIKTRITTANLVIGDVSGANPNVLFEIGYAGGRGVDVIQITQTPLHDLPFDIRNNNTLQYEPGRLHASRKPLADALKALA